MSLFDAVSQGARVPDMAQPESYVRDTQYHLDFYMLESAMREMGVLPKPTGDDMTSRPYDEDLKRLIAAVPLE